MNTAGFFWEILKLFQSSSRLLLHEAQLCLMMNFTRSADGRREVTLYQAHLMNFFGWVLSRLKMSRHSTTF